MKKALIVGAAGQDGYYLTKNLVLKDYSVYGVDRFASSMFTDQKKIFSGFTQIELSQSSPLVDYIRKILPDEIYYLAAHHFSSEGEENRTGQMAPFLNINVITPNAVLELLQTELPLCKFFYAASSQIFGIPYIHPQNEDTPFRPDTPYAISKATALLLCRYYRNTHGIFTATGILYNHESPHRSMSFVTAQIARAAALAAKGRGAPLFLKNVNAVVDWGAAEDYVEAMWCVLQQPCGGEFIISSGVYRTVMDFARAAFDVVGLKAEEYIFQHPGVLSSKLVTYVGDNNKIRIQCGWHPKKKFENLVKEMVEAHLLKEYP
jgi:GDPmannose 4,6-dehydratase